MAADHVLRVRPPQLAVRRPTGRLAGRVDEEVPTDPGPGRKNDDAHDHVVRPTADERDRRREPTPRCERTDPSRRQGDGDHDPTRDGQRARHRHDANVQSNHIHPTNSASRARWWCSSPSTMELIVGCSARGELYSAMSSPATSALNAALHTTTAARNAGAFRVGATGAADRRRARRTSAATIRRPAATRKARNRPG